MERFNFRLEPVLEHRKRLEDRAKQDFARAKEAEHQARQHLAGLESDFDEGKEDMTDVLTREINASEVNACHRYLDRLKQSIADQAELVTQLHVSSEEKRSKLVDGMKARKVVEKLKERQFDQYRIEFNRVEQKQTDEFATTRHRSSQAQV